MSYGVIYKITNKEDERCYIGRSIDPKRRWREHINEKKFNEEEYIFEIIAEYDSKEDLDEAEKYWINKYDSISNGYNKNLGGGGSELPLELRKKGTRITVLYTDKEEEMIKELLELSEVKPTISALLRACLIKYYQDKVVYKNKKEE